MDIRLEKINKDLLKEATNLWNLIIKEGNSFPGDLPLTQEEAWLMFQEQTETICALSDNDLVGLYILHPNNIGRCSHIANASYAVTPKYRSMGIGRILVKDSIKRAKKHQFCGLQFNAVVAFNTKAISLYLALGFHIIGTIPGGYRMADETYADTLIFLKTW